MFSSDPKTFYQAVMFGVVSILIGLILSIIFSFLKPKLPDECSNWDEYYIMEVIMFTTGFILRYLITNDTVGKYLYSADTN
jgi:hypothetical protein